MVPQIFIPYFTVIGHAQTMDECNYFGEYVVKACTLSEDKVGNNVLLNNLTDGLSCETSWNIHTITKYLEGNINNCSFSDTNQNVKIFH